MVLNFFLPSHIGNLSFKRRFLEKKIYIKEEEISIPTAA
jgi:hypothetical protein